MCAGISWMWVTWSISTRRIGSAATGELPRHAHGCVLDLLPAAMETADMVPDAPGLWMLHCQVDDHMQAGMMARYEVQP